MGLIINEIKLRSGVLSNSLCNLNSDLPLKYQLDDLFTDLFFIRYITPKGDFIIDIEWGPVSFQISENSYFGVKLVRDGDWGHPLFDDTCSTLDELVAMINSTVDLLHEKYL